MLKNYLKIAWRNLLKDKQQTLINLLGLTIGTISCLTILLYVFDQTGYDQHHEESESIYRVRMITDGSGAGTETVNAATTGPPIAFALKEDFPEIEQVARVISIDLFNVDMIKASGADEGLYESRAYLADSTFFQIFNYRMLEGNSRSLNEPSTLVLSSTLAKKLFGNEKAIDKVVEISGYSGEPNKLIVKGVFDEHSGKSHLNPNYIISMNTPGLGAYVLGVTDYVSNTFIYTYAKLKPGTSAQGLQQKLPDFLKSRAGTQLEERGIKRTLILQKLTDIHLYSNGITSQIDRVSNIQYLYILAILALFIQLIACVNFINLSTARANKRGKEIGIRKVMGADKSSLIFQFLGESLLLSFFAVLISVPITIALLPFINELAESNLTYINLMNGSIILLLILLGLFTGLLAGIYPALVLSSVKTIAVLKNVITKDSKSGNLRRTLVVFQFMLSIGLTSIVIVIWQQFNYTQDKNLGFNKENLISLELNTESARTNFYPLKSQYINIPGVKSITGNWVSPSEEINYELDLYLPGKSAEEHIEGNLNWISEDYTKTAGITLLDGRGLRQNDSTQVMVNESTLRVMGIQTDNAIGSKIFSASDDGDREFEIVGVVSDFHYASFKQAIAPLILQRIAAPRRMLIRLEAGNLEDILANMRQTWKSTVTSTPFMHSFVDKGVERRYKEEKRIGKIAAFFTILAILISTLGLFGLVSYTAEQKKKEIGIRKVLGASINSVVLLLTKDFIKLVIIAFLIAVPISYLLMQRWLENYTYKIDIEWWTFLLAGSGALVITFLTVGFQSIKSATTNPVESIRTE
jgi:putative ABC transport system permease protein